MRGLRGLTPPVAVAAMAIVALLVGSGGAVTALGPSASSPSAEDAMRPVQGYPQRIGFERPSPRLPERPGPLAATMYDNAFGTGRELGVTADGGLWELTPGVNVLSYDGRLLLSRRAGGFAGPLQVRDLATGERRGFDDIGETFDTTLGRRFRYLLDSTAPVHWSTNGSAILTKLGEAPQRNRSRPMALDVDSGKVVAVRGEEPAGFRSPTQVVTVSKRAEGGRTHVTATTTELETGVRRALRLRLTSPWRGDPDDRLHASTSPDGSMLLLIEVAGGADAGATLRMFSLSDGRELSPRSVRGWDRCTPTWLGNDPVVPTESHPARSELVTQSGSRSLVAVQPRLQSSCLQLTPAALEAGPVRALFGTWGYSWTWYWWQLLLGGSLALFALAAFLWFRQERSV